MSKIEVNQISSQCGSTLTIGQSGDTIQLACGATQTGFGRTGTVDWDTTAKTASFTAVSGTGYFVNTTSGAITLTLPASPSAGDIVAFKDYAGTFATNNLTIARNGSNLDGSASDKAIDTNHTSMSLVYVDATQGWKSVEEGTGFIGENFLSATGGTITTSGDYKIHTFTGPGDFTVQQLSDNAADNTVSYMVVAGGASGGRGNSLGGGGGAGGFREYKGPSDCYTASPLNGNPGGTAVTVTATSYPITVGAGGAPLPAAPAVAQGNPGSNSVFSTIISAGGGGGGGWNATPGLPGGSGGGSGNSSPSEGAGNTPPVSPPQGQPGGNRCNSGCGVGGGGGATQAGDTASGGTADGGDGAQTSINGTATYYAGGGGGGANLPSNNGGQGGGGEGGFPGPGTDGTANTGGGGGGNYQVSASSSGAGGSGIVIIRYKYQ